MPSNYAATKRYAKRQQGERRLVRLTVWVPEDARDHIIALAAKLRRIAKAQQQE